MFAKRKIIRLPISRFLKSVCQFFVVKVKTVNPISEPSGWAWRSQPALSGARQFQKDSFDRKFVMSSETEPPLIFQSFWHFHGGFYFSWNAPFRKPCGRLKRAWWHRPCTDLPYTRRLSRPHGSVPQKSNGITTNAAIHTRFAQHTQNQGNKGAHNGLGESFIISYAYA